MAHSLGAILRCIDKVLAAALSRSLVNQALIPFFSSLISGLFRLFLVHSVCAIPSPPIADEVLLYVLTTVIYSFLGVYLQQHLMYCSSASSFSCQTVRSNLYYPTIFSPLFWSFPSKTEMHSSHWLLFFDNVLLSSLCSSVMSLMYHTNILYWSYALNPILLVCNRDRLYFKYPVWYLGLARSHTVDQFWRLFLYVSGKYR